MPHGCVIWLSRAKRQRTRTGRGRSRFSHRFSSEKRKGRDVRLGVTGKERDNWTWRSPGGLWKFAPGGARVPAAHERMAPKTQQQYHKAY
eukprot:gene23835-biopygen4364